jgi:HD domain
MPSTGDFRKMRCAISSVLSRRSFLGNSIAATSIGLPSTRAQCADELRLPSEVAGITIPNSVFAKGVAGYAQRSMPDFLFNHCMRTFVFGALYVRQLPMSPNLELAFAAAAFHDLGLLTAYESPKASFEIDGANAAERASKAGGLSDRDADVVWHAVEMHDGKWAVTKRQGPEAMLVAFGAASDVDGPDYAVSDEHQIREIVGAFPRLGFKVRFTELLVNHCKRKPLSQRSTWLEGLCRQTVPDAWTDTVENEIQSAPFSE